MKFCALIFIALLLNGCGIINTYHYERYPILDPEIAEDVQLFPNIVETHKHNIIFPFVYDITVRGAPYTLDISFQAKSQLTNSVSLTEVTFTNATGEDFHLLKQPLDVTPKERKYWRSPKSGYTTYTPIYEHSIAFIDLPVNFSSKKECKIKIHYTVGKEARVNEWVVSGLKKKTYTVMSDWPQDNERDY